jgi:hypothetical protein
MSEFVCEQTAPRACPWGKLVPVKNHIVTDGVSMSTDRASRLCGFGIGMHADAAEIVPETRLEKGTRSGIQRLAWRAQNPMDDRGNCIAKRSGFGVPVRPLDFRRSAEFSRLFGEAFRSAFLAFPAEKRRSAAGAFPLQETRAHGG